MRRLLLGASIAGCLVAGSCWDALRADTVYLKNGAWIDGRVQRRGDVVEIEIGDLGKVEVKMEEVYEIEKNNRTGETAEAVAGPAAAARSGGPGAPAGSAGAASAGGTRDASGRSASEPSTRDAAGDAGEPGEPTEADAEPEESSEAAEPTTKEPPIDPELRGRIEQLVLDLQRQKPQFRTRAERQLKSIGAPCVPFLVPISRSSSELTRVAVFRVLEEVGDDRAVDTCIQALSDANEYVRDYAHKALKRITGQDHGYVALATPRRREIAIAKWRDWWANEKKLRADAAREQATKS